MAFPPTLASYGPAADVGIWVHVIDDTYRLTTLGEYWSDIWSAPAQEEEWMKIFAEDPQYEEDPCG